MEQMDFNMLPRFSYVFRHNVIMGAIITCLHLTTIGNGLQGRNLLHNHPVPSSRARETVPAGRSSGPVTLPTVTHAPTSRWTLPEGTSTALGSYHGDRIPPPLDLNDRANDTAT